MKIEITSTDPLWH